MTSADTATTFRARTRRVVESFLQTVVVLDDLATMPPPDEEPQRPSGEELSVPEEYRGSRSPEPGPIPAPSDLPLNADQVISGFAETGSVCAVLHPPPGETLYEKTVKVAARADIVVLDWKIHESTGHAALEIVRGILEDDQNNHRLRLIAIYTGEPDLKGISSEIRAVLTDFYREEPLVELNPFRISKGPLQIAILAKQGAVRSPEFAEQEVSETRLANRLIDEFALMTEGLLANVAIAGITAIRHNAHRILAKFDETLDAAYLGHRMLLPHPPDAEGQLEEALASEVRSVLEEDRSGGHADDSAIGEWLRARAEQGVDLSDPFSFQGATDITERWGDLLRLGIGVNNPPLPEGVKKQKLKERSTEPFAPDIDAATSSNRRFAALLNLKTHYPSHRPQLTLGTILLEEDDQRHQYLLCLQPKCDSIRRSEPTGFPLIPLVAVTPADRFRLVVEVGHDAWKHFDLSPKPSELVVRRFSPGPNPPGEVHATSEEGMDGYYFKDTGGHKYRWVAQLKDEHALGVAGEIAAALARPGPNDAEWLRQATNR